MTGVTLSDTEPLHVAYDDMDEDDVPTNVSDVVDEYVRLSFASGMPKLRGRSRSSPSSSGRGSSR
jgi:hypothetical protein